MRDKWNPVGWYFSIFDNTHHVCGVLLENSMTIISFYIPPVPPYTLFIMYENYIVNNIYNMPPGDHFPKFFSTYLMLCIMESPMATGYSYSRPIRSLCQLGGQFSKFSRNSSYDIV